MKKEDLKVFMAITAFLMLSFGVVISFFEKGKLAFKNEFIPQRAAGSFAVQGTNPLVVQKIDEKTIKEYKNLDLDKASKASGLDKNTLKDIVSKIVGGGLGPCLGSSGGIQVIGNCTPPGPGTCMGQEGPGRDMCWCSVTGLKGGSITARCIAGCCRAVSYTGSSGALGGLSPAQLLQAGMQGFSLLQKLMGGEGGSSGGGGYFPPNYDNFAGNTDTIDVGNTDTNFDTLNEDTALNFDTIDYTTIVKDNATENALSSSVQKLSNARDRVDTIISNNEGSSTESVIVRKIEVKTKTQKNIPAIDEFTGTNADLSGKQEDASQLEFQVVGQETETDPRLAKLRDIESSAVRRSVLTKEEKRYNLEIPRQDRSWWQVIVDFIMSPFR